MANKTKIRSIRLSEEVEDLINQQIGSNFTEKFDRLVYNCCMLVPAREKQIKELDEQIRRRREALESLREDFNTYSRKSTYIASALNRIFNELDTSDFEDWLRDL